MVKYSSKRSSTGGSSFMAHFSESFLADLGRIVAAWSHVEHKFDAMFLLPMLLKRNPHPADSDVNALLGMAFERRVRAYREYLDSLELSDDARKMGNQLLSQLVTLRRERDEVAHSVWSPKLDADTKLVPDAAQKLFKSWHNSKPHKVETATQERLKEIFERMHSLYWELSDLLFDPGIVHPKPRQP